MRGSLPAELGNLSQLTELDLWNNGLSGSIPAELGSLSNLLYLFLMDNQLSGSIPAELGNLSNLLFLRLDNNQLSGPIPAELGRLSNLQRLFLGGTGNRLTGCIPTGLQYIPANETDLHRLGLSYCTSATPPSNSDRAALVALYNATGGFANQWNNEDGNWLSDQSR